MKLEAEEFERLALEQADMLYRVARRLAGGGAEEANDLVQETYLRALRSRDGFDLQEHGIRPWLIRIMHNLYLTRAEREKRQPVAMEADALEGNSARVVGDVPFSDDNLQNMDERLVKALALLAPEYRMVLLLWAVEELSYKEIAEAVDVPIGTVMSRLYRARHRLARALRGFAVQEGIIRE
jgi:RNA polymerase sigma-70 factor (ECF subfamily)